MTRDEMISMLEQHIECLERGQADPQLDPMEDDWRLMQDALDGTVGLLQRLKAGDKAAIEEVSALLETG
jgi:hypothetical protein